jgi:hypothetical protein
MDRRKQRLTPVEDLEWTGVTIMQRAIQVRPSKVAGQLWPSVSEKELIAAAFFALAMKREPNRNVSSALIEIASLGPSICVRNDIVAQSPDGTPDPSSEPAHGFNLNQTADAKTH